MPQEGDPSQDGSHAARARRTGYWAWSQQPLHVLVFLTPFVILFEIGSLRYLVDEAGRLETIRAKRLISGFFEVFGPTGLLLPGVALLLTLLIWHWLTPRARWRVRPPVLGRMLLESIAWVLPFLVLSVLLGALGIGASSHAATALAGTGPGIYDQPWPARLTIAIGAGIYEELLFRLIGFALVHAIVVDLARASERTGQWAAILITSLAFAAYHFDHWPAPIGPLTYYLVAGLYFAALYSVRGLGIATGTHALYDAAVLVALPGLS